MSGSYTLISKLGEGGMAEVFKAIKKGPSGFEKPIALKRILPYLADQKPFINMLSDEARLHAHLNHPNIVQILDFFKYGESYMIALEYIAGKNLRQIMRDSQQRALPIPWQGAIHIMTEVLKGLEFSHKKTGPQGHLGIVHRDVSPQNILVSYEGAVKLSDFGIAWANIERDQTQSGMFKGKQRYLAPEQLKSKKVDFRTDLFSAGVVLYEMVCHKHPFETGSEFETMKRIEEGKFAPSSQIRPDLPTYFHETLSKALNPNPFSRPKDAEEFRLALVSIQESTWASQGNEDLAHWISQLYPFPSDCHEIPVEKTPVLSNEGSILPAVIDPSQSIIPKIEDGSAEITSQTNLTKYLWLVGVVISVPLIFVLAFWQWKLTQTAWKNQVSPSPVHEPKLTPSMIPTSIITPAPIPLLSQMKPPSVSKIKSSPPKPTINKRQKPGFLRMNGPLGANVFVNGQNIGKLPMNKFKLPVGEYVVLIAPDPGPTSMARVQVKAGEIASVYWTRRPIRFKAPK